jgi:hypothetical protein
VTYHGKPQGVGNSGNNEKGEAGMDNKTKGAWIVHHKSKLDMVSGTQSDFVNIALAGKCSVLLSAISGTNANTISNQKLDALASAVDINPKLELFKILSILEGYRLIDRTSNEIGILGLTTTSILEYTTKIYQENEPNKIEESVISLSEKASESPVLIDRAQQFISDTYRIDSSTSKDIIENGKQIGVFDYEKTTANKELIFNGNLFRNNDLKRIVNILSSLSSSESKLMSECNNLLDSCGCMLLDDIIKITGRELFEKLQSIGIYDLNLVKSDIGEEKFVTKPSSFCKFTASYVDDAFDLAKAFVASITFGMIKSTKGRGKIRMVEALLGKLINGQWVGPATAIGHDYKILEMKGVLNVRLEKDGLFSMKLLKKEVGELALAVIQDGSAVPNALSSFPSASIFDYLPPEHNRIITRKNLTMPIKKSVSELLDSIRTGDLQ